MVLSLGDSDGSNDIGMIDGSIGNEHSCTTLSLDSTNANKEESLEVMMMMMMMMMMMTTRMMMMMMIILIIAAVIMISHNFGPIQLPSSSLMICHVKRCSINSN